MNNPNIERTGQLNSMRLLGWMASKIGNPRAVDAIQSLQARQILRLADIGTVPIDIPGEDNFRFIAEYIPNIYSRIDRISGTKLWRHVRQVEALTRDIIKPYGEQLERNASMAALLHDFGSSAGEGHGIVSWKVATRVLPSISKDPYRSKRIQQAVEMHNGHRITQLIGQGSSQGFAQRRHLLQTALSKRDLFVETVALHAADKLALVRKAEANFHVKMELVNVDTIGLCLFAQSSDVPMNQLLERLNKRSAKIRSGLASLLALYPNATQVQFNIMSEMMPLAANIPFVFDIQSLEQSNPTFSI